MTFSYKAGNPNGPCGSFSPIPLSVEQLNNLQNTISIWPNPAGSSVTVNADRKLITIYVSNAIGQVLLTKTCNSNIETIDLARFPDGMYTLCTQQNDGTIRYSSLVVIH
jgi:hypothetical protein